MDEDKLVSVVSGVGEIRILHKVELINGIDLVICWQEFVGATRRVMMVVT
jgi:hypothetical protein